ncbi:hypothetical protein QTP70_013315 [Hemibagrus guttatus]|uniref:DUF4939 domain-containing protein n=1 Tax=Hemibagrus guttatus TaxID=175788 RepID=A0AAE0RC50_9TELE|nr:hypothetical protein QTP70_013315 [Hemibagrus guttatus]
MSAETTERPLLSPAHGSGCYRLRQTTATEYFAPYGSSGATRDYRAARSADPLLRLLNSAARAPPHPRPHGIRQQRACEVFFRHQPVVYRDEGTRCAFLLSLLTGKALDWASAMWDVDPQIHTSFTYFARMIREVFEYPAGVRTLSLPFALGTCDSGAAEGGEVLY